ncbi:MAG: TIGR02147 family protein, partial [Oligoflexus sp.]
MRYFNDQKLIFTERRRSTRERPNLYACASVCEILTMMMHQRILKNPGYSLRAYARDLGMSVSTLSGILKGLQNLSLQRAEDIALRLGINRLERDYFLLLVQAESMRQDEEKHLALQSAQALRKDFIYREFLAGEESWTCLHSLLVLQVRLGILKRRVTKLETFLDVSKAQLARTFDDLIRLGWLTEDSCGELSAPYGYLYAPGEGPAVRQLHRDLLSHAARALETLPLEQRFFYATFLTIRREDYPAFAKKMGELIREHSDHLPTQGQHDAVYACS